MTDPKKIEPTKLEVYKATKDKKDKEPALRMGANTGAVAGILSLIALLYPGLLDNHTTATILVIAAFVLPFITALLTRGKTWSIASVTELLNEAVEQAEDAARKKYR